MIILPRPRRVPRREREFRRLIERKIKEYGKMEAEDLHLALIGEAQDYLIKELGLPPAREKKLLELGAHTLRLMAAMSKARQGLPITVKTARAILARFLKEKQAYATISKKFLSKERIQLLEEMANASRTLLERLKSAQENSFISIGHDFISQVYATHVSIINGLLRNKVDLYEREIFKAVKDIGKILVEKGIFQ